MKATIRSLKERCFMCLPVNWGAKVPEKPGSKNFLEHRRVSGIPALLQSDMRQPVWVQRYPRCCYEPLSKSNFKFGPYLRVEANQQSGTAFPPWVLGASQPAPGSVEQLGTGNNPNLPCLPQALLHSCWFPLVKSTSLEPTEATGRLLCVHGLSLDLIL